MIFERGFQKPTAYQRRIVRCIADDTFTTRLPPDFFGKGDVPERAGWMVDKSSAVALRLRYVEPHNDEWAGGWPMPRRYSAMFWLVDLPRSTIVLHVGNMSQQMQEGDYVVFDDQVMHSLFSSKTWRGCAFQMVPIRRKKEG
jgi:hypothetical protein